MRVMWKRLWVLYFLLIGTVSLTLMSLLHQRNVIPTDAVPVISTVTVTNATVRATECPALPNPVTHVQPQDSDKTYRIIFMEGWMEDQWFYNSDFNVYLEFYSHKLCGYRCSTGRIGEYRLASARLIVFQPSALKLEPPRRKYDGQLWMLHSFQPLTDEDHSNIKSNGYDELLDFYLIQSQAPLPVRFLNRTHGKHLSQSVSTEHFMMPDAPRNLSIVQLLSSCTQPDPVSFKQMIDDSLGSHLKALRPDIQVKYALTCYGGTDNFKPDDKTAFYILDSNVCFNDMIDQLYRVLRAKQPAIPVLPRLPGSLSRETFTEFAPPGSFISYLDYGSVEGLFSFLRQVLADSELFKKYHRWRQLYDLDTEVSLDIEQSVACRLCQISHDGLSAAATRIHHNNCDLS